MKASRAVLGVALRTGLAAHDRSRRRRGVVIQLTLPARSVAPIPPVFLRGGDRRFAIVSIVVLAILALSRFGGRAAG